MKVHDRDWAEGIENVFEGVCLPRRIADARRLDRDACPGDVGDEQGQTTGPHVGPLHHTVTYVRHRVR